MWCKDNASFLISKIFRENRRFFSSFRNRKGILTIFKVHNATDFAMKNIKSILLIAISVLAAVGCTRKSMRIPRFGFVTVDTLLENSHAECRVAYGFASILNAAGSPALEAIEAANIGYFFQLEEFAGTTEEAMLTSLRETSATVLADMPEAGVDYEITAESTGEVFDTLLLFTITRSSYTGGAHGMYGIECHTYALKEGYEITTADLFGTERLPALTEAIRQKIQANYDADNDQQLIERGFFPEYIAPTENFRISEEGITFYYNPYEIGCYALGPVEVSLSREEMDSLRNG